MSKIQTFLPPPLLHTSTSKQKQSEFLHHFNPVISKILSEQSEDSYEHIEKGEFEPQKQEGSNSQVGNKNNQKSQYFDSIISIANPPHSDHQKLQSLHRLEDNSSQQSFLQKIWKGTSIQHTKEESGKILLDETKIHSKQLAYHSALAQIPISSNPEQKLKQVNRSQNEIQNKQNIPGFRNCGVRSKTNLYEQNMFPHYEVQNLIGIVDGLYQKAIGKKIEVQVNIQMETKKQNRVKKQKIVRQNAREERRKGEIIQIEKLRMKKKLKQLFNPDPSNRVILHPQIIPKYPYNLNMHLDLNIINQQQNENQELLSTQRVSIEILPQQQQQYQCKEYLDGNVENQSQHAEAQKQKELCYQSYSDKRNRNLNIKSMNDSNKWFNSEVSEGEEQKQKQIPDCKCKNHEIKMEEMMEQKRCQVQAEEKRNRTTIDRAALQQQYMLSKYKQMLDSKKLSTNKFENQRSKNEIEKIWVGDNLREPSVKSGVHEEDKKQIQSYIYEFTSHQGKEEEESIKNQNSPHITSSIHSNTNNKNTKSITSSKGVYQTILSQYSTSKLLAIYPANSHANNIHNKSASKFIESSKYHTNKNELNSMTTKYESNRSSINKHEQGRKCAKEQNKGATASTKNLNAKYNKNINENRKKERNEFQKNQNEYKGKYIRRSASVEVKNNINPNKNRQSNSVAKNGRSNSCNKIFRM